LSVATTGSADAATQSTSSSDRILEWEGCYNVRDLGGLRAADGRRIRWGALVRSDLPNRLTATGRRSLIDHGVRTIVDLRFRDEVEHDWDTYPFKDVAAKTGPTYLNVPFNTGRDRASDEEIRAAYRAATSRMELNRHDIDWNRGGIVAAVGAIADAPPGGVLVHCHAGKDRTGAVVALILALLGVPDEDIADDYALTALTLEPLIIEWLDNSSQDVAERDRLRSLAMPAREAMLDTLHHVRTRYASPESYLLGGGATEDQLARLRARLLDSA
jgi:protein tyrosine/serine phosphatase